MRFVRRQRRGEKGKRGSLFTHADDLKLVHHTDVNPCHDPSPYRQARQRSGEYTSRCQAVAILLVVQDLFFCGYGAGARCFPHRRARKKNDSVSTEIGSRRENQVGEGGRQWVDVHCSNEKQEQERQSVDCRHLYLDCIETLLSRNKDFHSCPEASVRAVERKVVSPDLADDALIHSRNPPVRITNSRLLRSSWKPTPGASVLPAVRISPLHVKHPGHACSSSLQQCRQAKPPLAYRLAETAALWEWKSTSWARRSSGVRHLPAQRRTAHRAYARLSGSRVDARVYQYTRLPSVKRHSTRTGALTPPEFGKATNEHRYREACTAFDSWRAVGEKTGRPSSYEAAFQSLLTVGRVFTHGGMGEKRAEQKRVGIVAMLLILGTTIGRDTRKGRHQLCLHFLELDRPLGPTGRPCLLPPTGC